MQFGGYVFRQILFPSNFPAIPWYLSGMVDWNSVFYSSGRAAIFEGPSPGWDEDTFFVENGEGKKLFTKIFTGKVSRLHISPRKP